MAVIALDAMGGDHGPSVVVPAALAAVKAHDKLSVILVGDSASIQQQLGSLSESITNRMRIEHTAQIVEMDEAPSQALRYKKNSSMRVAIDLVKEGLAQACVSAGNTGALMATARFVLRTLPGIDRPAILAELPTCKGRVRMLDLGANVDSSADHLFQFAVMGTVLIRAIDNIPHPKVGLLNIGAEEIKGNDCIKRTAQLLSESSIVNYVGYIEGDGIFFDDVDLIVCDGFVGNVALKTMEGAAKLIKCYLRDTFRRSWYTQLLGLMVKPVIQQVKKTIDPANYNGASLLGLRNIVIKSHGGADIKAFTHAIEEALLEVDKNVPERISRELAVLFAEE
jgi:glycerol-3-phosphate acyltransferase PlsX